MNMPERGFLADTHRFGFNGKETDEESGLQDYGFRIYNPGIAKFLSVDPLAPEYPWYTPYQFAGNKPIRYIDLDGAEEFDAFLKITEDGPKAFVKLVNSNAPFSVHWVDPTTTRRIIGRRPTTGTNAWIHPNGTQTLHNFFGAIREKIFNNGNWGVTLPNGSSKAYVRGEWAVFGPQDPPNTQQTTQNTNNTISTSFNFVPNRAQFRNQAVANNTFSRIAIASSIPPQDETNTVLTPISEQESEADPSYMEVKNNSVTTRTQTAMRNSTVTISLSTMLPQNTRSTNLLMRRVVLIRNGLMNAGIPFENIQAGSLTFGVPRNQMGGRPNLVNFVISATTITTTTTTTRTINTYEKKE